MSAGEGLLGLSVRGALGGHKDWIAGIAWSDDGRLVASGSGDRRVIVWRVPEGAPHRILEGHTEGVSCVAWARGRALLASGSADRTVRIWDVESGAQVRCLEGHSGFVRSLTWVDDGSLVASGAEDDSIRIWSSATGETERVLRGREGWVLALAVSPSGEWLAAGHGSGSIRLIDTRDWRTRKTLRGHDKWVDSVAWQPGGRLLASASGDRTVRVWDPDGRALTPVGILEGHTDQVRSVSFSADGQLLASKSDDGTVAIWRTDTWERLATLPEPPGHTYWPPSIAFSPRNPELITLGEGQPILRLWTVDGAALSRQTPRGRSVRYTSAKIVLVGDSGVGKTGLGWRLAHGEFREHPSTHGGQFWPLGHLRRTRGDGAECEAVLWDLAGQPDYRLIHALFIDDADLALVVFDSTSDDPLHGLDFWLRQLRVAETRASGERAGPVAILVAARVDRGVPRLSRGEIEAYCRQRHLHGYVATSARENLGVDELLGLMREAIPWDGKPATVTTTTFKAIKDYVLARKEDHGADGAIQTISELRGGLEGRDAGFVFSDDELLTAAGHLENHGYLTRLQTPRGEPRILLKPDLLNNVASSIVLEARANERGLGSLEEARLLGGGYRIPELASLSTENRAVLLDSAISLFLGHNICFRETDPLTGRAYLVFPELINLRTERAVEGPETVDGPAYTVSGPVENVFASLVVLLGYAPTFTRTNQWRHHARYEVGSGLVCGFRQEAEREGELDFVLYFGKDVGAPIRNLFQSLFESFLAGRDVAVQRLEPVECANGHRLNRAVIREHGAKGRSHAFCPECGQKIALPGTEEPIRLTKAEEASVSSERRVASRRSLFEQAIFRLKAFVDETKQPRPTCFISYAWGDPRHEGWVERLATDLLNAGVDVVLDRWRSRIGSSVPRFVERISRSDYVVVVGTPDYRHKYDNAEPLGGFVAGAEGDLIGTRMLGSEEEKASVLPVLAKGTADSSFPPLLQGRVYADFREDERYLEATLDLALSIFNAVPDDVRRGLRELLSRPPAS